MKGKIVYQEKSIKGAEIIIRYPEPGDAPKMTDYINTLSDEKTFISYQGEHETNETETKYLLRKLENIKNKKTVQLLVFLENELVGISEIELGTKTERHIGILGITISKNFREQGLGRVLMKSIIKEVKENLPRLEIITLGVFSDNSIAIKWYKKLGFIEEGRLPGGIKLENGYQDHIYMYMPVK